MVPPAFVVRLDNGVVPPTTPVNVVAPVVLTLKVETPSNVPPKVIAPAPVLLKVFVPVTTTSSLKLCALVVVTLPLMLVWPPTFVVMLVNAEVLPTLP